ncbi:unnamed protein product [Mytilus coruscus]|uniref:Uncharacterized protein n=1 Tax=Mytilus coruscus TaxID=42192 RepID=A0A6J8E073_MYTCO|nr:unnamed protein product [Mytilus coruscus]
MCQNIVGTEEYVKTLRIMSKVRDSFTHDHFFSTITSGSFGEGLVMRGSDFDFMDVMKNIEVFEDMNINFKPYTTYLKMKTNDTPPEYTQLHLVHSDIPKVLEACVEVDGEYYFSNMRLKEKMFENFFDIYHGPCLSDKNGKFDLALCVHVIYLFETFEYPSVKVENEIHRIMSFDNPKIKHFYAYYLSKMFSANAQLLPFPDISGNKSNYKRYNTCISTVLRSIRHNAVSGWLLLASFIYQTKQYKKSLAILQYSLSKCTSEKLYLLRSLSNSHYELLNFDIFRRMPIVQLFKFLRLDSIDFCESSYFKPVEIQNMQNETLQSIPPVVFAHFLRFLCYYHLNDNRQCQNSLCDLQLTIEENYFIA